MSRYADTEDFDRYGLPEGALAGDFHSDDVQAALDAASDIADSYLRGRFVLPITTHGGDLADAVCRIAAFNILSRRGYNPEGNADQVRLRYEDAIEWLKGVSTGRITPALTDSSSSTSGGGKGGPFVVAPRYDANGSFDAGPPVPRRW